MADPQEALAALWESDQFEPAIRHIRFPEFRNLVPHTRIDFLHPVTALVGPNGTNKTAILRALQGCPDNVNLGMHWFSTELDPIEEGTRHRFIYGYISKTQNEVVEVVKTRIKREQNPDYFEPARPILADGMARMPRLRPEEPVPSDRTRTRWTAISKDVVYLDFRSELSAFDKYWFHVPYTNRVTTLTEKKTLIRRRSKHVARALETGATSVKLWQLERIVEAATELDKSQVAAVSSILGRPYDSIRVITHRFFDVEGSSVVLTSNSLRYSEAFAGSGEFAVTMMVKAVTEAPDRSLILLDEPETSLHPGAQRNLTTFLSESAKTKKLQIVLSTHAPEIVSHLPPQAIKVLQQRTSDGKVQLVDQSSDPAEAFFRLGVKAGETVSIFVEDRLAEAIVQRSLRPLGEAINSMVRTAILPGGASAIQTRFIPSFAQSNSERYLVFLDGDQRPKEPLPSSASAVSDEDLGPLLESILGGQPQLSMSGSGGTASGGERLRHYRTVLAWIIDNLRYLPGGVPEVLLMVATGVETDQVSTSEAKEYWVKQARKALGREDWESVTANEIFAEQERALATVSQDSWELTQIREEVHRFLEDATSP